jgi:hypothetical protein
LNYFKSINSCFITCFYFKLDEIEIISVDSGDDAEPLAAGYREMFFTFCMGYDI